jgi:O-antigen/teichoic acid export membrane protein
LLQKFRELSKNSAIYGLGEVAIQIVSFLLLKVYVQFLTPTDYGVLALLGSIEAVAKLSFRWGVDGSFMRFWYDCEDEPSRQRLASTIFFFLLAVNGVLLLLALAISPFASTWLLDSPGYTLALVLVLLNTFAIGFTFIPFHVLRIQNRAREFSALAFGRSAATLLLRLLLVVGLGFGIMGVVIADVIVTAVMLAIMVRWFAPLIRPVFSRTLLRQALAFGLPRVPHGFALQLMSVGDRFVLRILRTPLDLIGTYSIGVSFGLVPKIALGAFEYAWAPFYYATSREPGAGKVFSGVTTYAVAALALMTAGLAACARDLLAIVTNGQYVNAESIVAWTAVGVFFYGIYLLTSIGLNITKHTQFYPVSTAIGAAANIGLNFALIPRFGILGAAWANAASYALQCGVAFVLSQRFYPIRYERGRIARAVGSAVVAYLAAIAVPRVTPLAGLVIRGLVVVGTMFAILWAVRFFQAEELRALNAMRRRFRRGSAVGAPPETTEMGGEIVATDTRREQVALESTKNNGRR